MEQTVVPKVIDELQALCALKGFFFFGNCHNLCYLYSLYAPYESHT